MKNDFFLYNLENNELSFSTTVAHQWYSSYTVPNDEMKMTVVLGITSYIHGDVLTIRVLFLIICLAHVWHMCHRLEKKIFPCWIWVVNVLFLWKNIFLFHMIGNKCFAFLLMRKKYFDWGRFWIFFYEHNENIRRAAIDWIVGKGVIK
jgi:hypothetical protein